MLIEDFDSTGKSQGVLVREFDNSLKKSDLRQDNIFAIDNYNLIDAGKDTHAVLNEIYYALNAIERLDAGAEKFFNPNKPLSLNGFFIRDDIPYNMFTKVTIEVHGMME